jgi:hypothetical protein
VSDAARPDPVPFEYAVLQAVPRVDRGECVNVGVVLYSQAEDFLAAAVHVDEGRLRMLDGAVDVDGVRAALAAVSAVCAGAPEAGEAAAAPVRARFGWLTAPRSTVVRAGPVHCGMTTDPAAHLARLLDRLVR